MASLSSIDFSPGLAFQALVWERFGATAQVSFVSLDHDFFLIASISRSAVRVDVDSVALFLQAVLGGNAPNFRVLHLAIWNIRFSINGKHVGIMVHRLSKFTCKFFAIHFTLWRDGDPDSIKEKDLWDAEQAAEWIPAPGSKSKRSYADVAAQPVKSDSRASHPNYADHSRPNYADHSRSKFLSHSPGSSPSVPRSPPVSKSSGDLFGKISS
ncbi:unnamed protein product [Urochloa humidicola]